MNTVTIWNAVETMLTAATAETLMRPRMAVVADEPTAHIISLTSTGMENFI